MRLCPIAHSPTIITIPDITRLTLTELRTRLRALGLSATGRKQTLVERLTNVAQNGAAAAATTTTTTKTDSNLSSAMELVNNSYTTSAPKDTVQHNGR